MQRKDQLIALLAISTMLTLLAGCNGHPSQQSPPATSKVEPDVPTLTAETQTISGGMFLNLQSGESQILRGQPIALCKDELSGILDDKTDPYLSQLKRGEFGGYIDEDKPFMAIHRRLKTVVGENEVQITKTNIDGKYQFLDVRPGRYCLFSETIRPLGERYQWAIWVLPVNVERQAVSVDLENSTIKYSGKLRSAVDY